MALTLAEKILQKHLLAGKLQPGEEITIKLDQCLLQDATGTMAWLEYESIGIPRVKPFSVQYIDHNLLQEDNKNMDDHLFLVSIASSSLAPSFIKPFLFSIAKLTLAGVLAKDPGLCSADISGEGGYKSVSICGYKRSLKR